MSYSINSESNDDVLSYDMTEEQYNDLMDNQLTIDNYFDISRKIYDEIFNDLIVNCPNDLYKDLHNNSHIEFWKFISENCIGIKYLNHINTIYNFKMKYNK